MKMWKLMCSRVEGLYNAGTVETLLQLMEEIKRVYIENTKCFHREVEEEEQRSSLARGDRGIEGTEG